MDKSKITGKYILIYTAIFALVCAVVFFPFVRSGRCLVGDGDGQSQYILQLEYMGRWLRQAAGGFLHGDFTPPRFDFSIGMGDDIMSVVRFHPLDFLSVFVPEEGTEYLYQFLIFLRLYLAGIAFSVYAFAWKRATGAGDGRDSSWAVLSGSMVYLFSGYTFSLGIVHPTYLSPLITLPLLLLGAERMMHRKEEHRFVLFTVVTALSFVSNYYFMYIASVAAVLYVFVRFFQVFRENRIRQFLILLLRFVLAYGTGLLISLAVLLPTLKRYTLSYRSDHLTQLKNLFFYEDRRRYAAWLINLISPLRASGNGTHLNYAVLVIPALILLFAVKRETGSRKERGQERVFLRICALILLAFLLIPAGGFLLAAMNNENNRWVFLIALLMGGVVSFTFPDFLRISRRGALSLAAGCIVYDLAVAASFVWMGFDVYPAAGAAQLTAATVLILLFARRASRERLRVLLVCVCLTSAAADGVMTFARPFGNLTRYYRRQNNTLSWYRNSAYANYLNVPRDGSFFRVDGVFTGNKEDNASLLLGYRGIQMYNSVMNASVIDALLDTGGAGLTTMLHTRYLDGRTAAQEIAGVRYYMVSPSSSAAVPYGYGPSPVYDDGKKQIYENAHPLSLSFGTDTVMARSEYEKLTEAEREYVCLEAAVLDDEAADGYAGARLSADQFRSSFRIQEYPVEASGMEDGIEELTEEDGGRTFRVTDRKARYFFRAKMQEGYATYLVLEDLVPSAAAKLHVAGEDVRDRLTLLTEEETYTLRRTNYIVNLGVGRGGEEKEISLRFSGKGSCRIGRLRTVLIPMEGYEEKVERLREREMNDVQILDDLVTGSVNQDTGGILLFSIPFSEGWSAEVDGAPARLLKADGCWMGLNLEKGAHEIRLRYRTPMLAEGRLCSVLGLSLLLLGVVFFRRRRGTKGCRQSRKDSLNDLGMNDGKR